MVESPLFVRTYHANHQLLPKSCQIIQSKINSFPALRQHMLTHAFDIQSTLHILDVTAKTAEDLLLLVVLLTSKMLSTPKEEIL